MTGAEALIEALRLKCVSHVFGIPGTHTPELHRALGKTPGIEHITTTHEQGAAFMAEGYARATGRAGVCLITNGAGRQQPYLQLRSIPTNLVREELRLEIYHTRRSATSGSGGRGKGLPPARIGCHPGRHGGGGAQDAVEQLPNARMRPSRPRSTGREWSRADTRGCRERSGGGRRFRSVP